MRKELEEIANEILNNSHLKPNYSNRDFMNAMIIFQSAIMCKMFELQNSENIDFEDRLKMANRCGIEIHKLIKTYTGLDTHKVEEFL